MKVVMIDSLVGNDYALCLCQGLANAGVAVELVTVEGRRIDRALFDFPVFFAAPPKDGRKSKLAKLVHYLQYLYWLVAFLRRNQVKVVHYQFFRRERLDSLFFVLLRLLQLNLVYTAHNVLPHEHSRIDYFLRYLVYRSAQKIIVHSHHIKHKLLDHYAVAPEKIEVVAHGNFDVYVPKEKIGKEAARKRLNLAVDDQLLLFFGYIREYKGLDILLDSFDLARQQNCHLKLVVAGKPHTAQLGRTYQQQIARLQFPRSVIFAPHFIPTSEVATYFIAADIIALPYRRIDHSGILHMAYSFGRPIIATDVGDFSEAVEHGKSGYIVPGANAPALAKAIQTAFTDASKLQAMADYAQMLSRTKYSWDDISRKTIAIYQQF